MTASKGQTAEYRHIEVDNPICSRRFHLCFEQGGAVPVQKHVKVDCPHCGVTVFEADNHAQVILAREENLVASPDGSRPLVGECRFVLR